MSLSYEFSAVGISDEKLQSYTDLFVAAFPSSNRMDTPYLRWLYRDNPAGKAVGYDAISKGKLAAHYVTVPFRARWAGRSVRGLLSLNTATHPAHQGKGLFTKLTQMTFDLAREQGYEFIIGVANANSTHGFVKKLGFQLVRPLQAYVGVGSLEFTDPASSQFSRVWDEQSTRWRLENPHARYYGVKDAAGLRIETRLPNGIRSVLGRTEFSMGELAKRKPLGPIKLSIGLNHVARKRGIFVNLPMRLRASPLNLIFKDLSPGARTLDAEQVRFSAMDFDAF